MAIIHGSSPITSPTQPLNEPKARSFGEIILSVLRAISNLGRLFSCFSSHEKLDQHELTVITDRDRPFSPSPTGGCPSSPSTVEEVANTVFLPAASFSPARHTSPYQGNLVRDAADDAALMCALSKENRPIEYYLDLTQSPIGGSQLPRATSPSVPCPPSSLSTSVPSALFTPVAPSQRPTQAPTLSTSEPRAPLTPVTAHGYFNPMQAGSFSAKANDLVMQALMGGFEPCAGQPVSQIQHNPHDQESFLREFSTPYGEASRVQTAKTAPRTSEQLRTSSARLSSYTPATSFEDDPLALFETTSVPPAKAQTTPSKPLTEKQIAVNLAREEKEEVQFQLHSLNLRLKHAEKGSRFYQSLLASLEKAKLELSRAERRLEEATAKLLAAKD